MPDTSSRSLSVFLCHSAGDKPTVRELYQKLNSEGWIDVWLDEEKLLAGQDWEYEIEKALDKTDAVIVALSTSSVSKEGYIQKELRFALDIALEKPEGTIFVLPLRLDDCERPRKLRNIHSLDYFPFQQRELAYFRLRQSLEQRASALGIGIAKAKKNTNSTRQTLKTTEQDHISFLSETPNEKESDVVKGDTLSSPLAITYRSPNNNAEKDNEITFVKVPLGEGQARNGVLYEYHITPNSVVFPGLFIVETGRGYWSIKRFNEFRQWLNAKLMIGRQLPADRVVRFPTRAEFKKAYDAEIVLHDFMFKANPPWFHEENEKSSTQVFTLLKHVSIGSLAKSLLLVVGPAYPITL